VRAPARFERSSLEVEVAANDFRLLSDGISESRIERSFASGYKGCMKERSVTERNEFYSAMQPRWNEVATLLAADRPPEWEGYRFEARVKCEHPAVPEQFTIEVSFGDRVRNRLRGGVPRKIVDKIAELRMAYLDFSPAATWRSVIIEQIWKPETKTWAFETNWTY